MAPLLELEHIVDALKGFKRPLREGRLAVSNLIVVGVKFRSHDTVSIEALCVRTTKIGDHPVKINVDIDIKTDQLKEKIRNISCECTAGSCKEHCCKHSMAVVIYLERHDEEELEILTCTGVEQMWGGLAEKTLQKFDPVPLKELCHHQKPPPPYKRPIKEVTKEMTEEFRAMFLEAQPDSEAAVFLSGVRAPPLLQPQVITDDVKSVLNHIFSKSHYIIGRTKELTEKLLNRHAQLTVDYVKCTREHKTISNQRANSHRSLVLSLNIVRCPQKRFSSLIE